MLRVGQSVDLRLDRAGDHARRGERRSDAGGGGPDQDRDRRTGSRFRRSPGCPTTAATTSTSRCSRPNVVDRPGAGRRRADRGGPARHPQQRVGGRGGLQQPVLRRAARRPAAGVHVQSRRGAGGGGGERGRERRVRALRRGGFVNVITKSGTNELHGSLHYFGKFDALSGTPQHTSPGGNTVETFNPDFSQHQFGFTLGGPLKQDRAFFFVAYDQQIYDDTKQKTRPASAAARFPHDVPEHRLSAERWRSDFGPIARTNDARAALAKLDFRLSDRHNLSLKYNYTWSQQQNGTFDVDTWGASANGLEQDHSNAVNGSLISFLVARLERVAVPVRAGGPAPARTTGRPTESRRSAAAAVPRHRHRFRERRSGSACRSSSRSRDHDTRIQAARQRLVRQRQPSVQVRRRVEPHRDDADVPRLCQRAHGVRQRDGVPQLRQRRARSTSSAPTGRSSMAPGAAARRDRRSPARSSCTCSSRGRLAHRGAGGHPVAHPATSSPCTLQDTWKPSPS